METIRKYEYLRMPAKGLVEDDGDDDCDWSKYMAKRPEVEGQMLPTLVDQRAKNVFLPYDWGHIG